MREAFSRRNREKCERSSLRGDSFGTSDNSVDVHFAFHDNRPHSLPPFPRSGSSIPVAIYLESLEEVMLPATANRNARPSRPLTAFYALCLLLIILCTAAWAAQPDRIVATIDNSQTVVLKGNVSPKAEPQNDQGPVDPSMKLPFITLLIQPSADQQAALEQVAGRATGPIVTELSQVADSGAVWPAFWPEQCRRRKNHPLATFPGLQNRTGRARA